MLKDLRLDKVIYEEIWKKFKVQVVREKRQIFDLADNEEVKILITSLDVVDDETLKFFLEVKKKLKIYLIILLYANLLFDDKIKKKLFYADDFIVLPAKLEEVMLRVEKIFRTKVMAKDVIEKNSLKIDVRNHEMFVAGEKKRAAPKEIELLYKLVYNENLLLTREQILRDVWGYKYIGQTRTVDVHIKRLRAKLKLVEDKYKIETVWGVGYIFKTIG